MYSYVYINLKKKTICLLIFIGLLGVSVGNTNKVEEGLCETLTLYFHVHKYKSIDIRGSAGTKTAKKEGRRVWYVCKLFLYSCALHVAAASGGGCFIYGHFANTTTTILLIWFVTAAQRGRIGLLWVLRWHGGGAGTPVTSMFGTQARVSVLRCYASLGSGAY